jgi:ribosomal-protein-alanine N-acetyltransferase
MKDINTDRLIIRRFRESDLVDFLNYQTCPEVLLYMDNEPMSEEKAMQFLNHQIALKDNEKGAYHAFAVQHRSHTKVIGDVGFYLEAGPENKGDLGFQFHPAYHRLGYAKEAVGALLQHGFTQLALSLVTSCCDARNVASFRLMESLGMKLETHLKQSRTTRGILHDEYQYVLRREVWMVK